MFPTACRCPSAAPHPAVSQSACSRPCAKRAACGSAGAARSPHNEPGDADVLIRDGVTYATIELRRRDFDPYYNGYANGTLWPLCHYLLSGFHFSDEQYDAYQRVNRLFAQKLAPLLKPDDVIWVHDYHLIPLAERLRELGVANPIGFFLHIPFPHIEMLRILPTHAELLREMTAYDVAGFQTENDMRAFHSGVHTSGVRTRSASTIA